jgi:chloramphenicol O-acetyltransferase type A
MSHYLNIAAWPRREHYEFFKAYDRPHFNVCAPVEVTNLRAFTRRRGLSLFVAYHYLSTKTANEIEPFRYRLRDDGVLVHEQVNTGATILLPDERFTFVYFDYDDDFVRYHEQAQAAVAAVKAGDGNLRPHTTSDDLLHHTVLPWLAFTSFAHARKRGQDDSVPKISFGKVYAEGDAYKMPVSVEVHHALMDGLHVGRYFERFAQLCAAPEELERLAG